MDKKVMDEVGELRGRVMEVILEYRFREVGKAKIYFVDGVGDMRLRSILSEAEEKDVRKVCHYINPGEAIEKYSVGIRGKHRQITQKETTRKYIEGDFEVWKNTLIKDAREIISVHQKSDHEIEIINEEVNNKIEIARGELAYILENYDKVVVKIAGFTHQKYFPYIQYVNTIDGEKKKQNEHLSVLVPNILYYNPTRYRSDIQIDDFIKSSKNPFGDVYYMEQVNKDDDSED